MSNKNDSRPRGISQKALDYKTSVFHKFIKFKFSIPFACQLISKRKIYSLYSAKTSLSLEFIDDWS